MARPLEWAALHRLRQDQSRYRWYALGAALFGYLVDRTGSYRVAWVAAAVAVLIGLVATLRVHEGRRGG
jgi:cyanate permease